jgi:hypothetical protein
MIWVPEGSVFALNVIPRFLIAMVFPVRRSDVQSVELKCSVLALIIMTFLKRKGQNPVSRAAVSFSVFGTLEQI